MDIYVTSVDGKKLRVCTKNSIQPPSVPVLGEDMDIQNSVFYLGGPIEIEAIKPSYPTRSDNFQVILRDVNNTISIELRTFDYASIIDKEGILLKIVTKRIEKQRIEKQRIEKQRIEKQKIEQQKIEQQRIEKQRIEQQRIFRNRVYRNRSSKRKSIFGNGFSTLKPSQLK